MKGFDLRRFGPKPETAHSAAHQLRAENKRARRRHTNLRRVVSGGMLPLDGPRGGYVFNGTKLR